MKFRKIVITGAAGFIGSHVYDLFAQKFPDANIQILDKMTYAANINNVLAVFSNPRHKLIVGDVVDFDLCLQVTKDADLVINLAAESHVDNSFSNSILFSKSNLLGTHTLVEACRINKVDRIIHVSTDEVYGESGSTAFHEDSSLNPTNPYSASKAAAEMIVKSYHKSFSLPIIVVRANNIYGVRQYPEKIIPKFITHCIQGKGLKLHGRGENLRHYLSAYDFAEALHLLAIGGVFGEQYNIASDLELTNLQVAKLILEAFSLDLSNITYIEDRPFNDCRYYVDDTKMRSLGWSPKRTLIQDIPELIEWYKINLQDFL